ncbi:unnamed protein product, partial [Staurois parvus]
HWPPFSVLHPSLPIPSTGLHSVFSIPSLPILHWPPFSVLHPLSATIPPLASIQCPPILSAQSLHWLPLSDVLHPLSSISLSGQSPPLGPPLSVLHPSLPKSPPLSSDSSVSSIPSCQ